jgi:hypothetical protein
MRNLQLKKNKCTNIQKQSQTLKENIANYSLRKIASIHQSQTQETLSIYKIKQKKLSEI